MEDTEYLPTCGFRPVGSRRKEMKGKFLTSNIILTAVCLSDRCDHSKPMNLHEAMYEVDKSCVTGELVCDICGCLMKIDEEFVIHN
jgi:transcription elongation factor Elf1